MVQSVEEHKGTQACGVCNTSNGWYFVSDITAAAAVGSGASDELLDHTLGMDCCLTITIVHPCCAILRTMPSQHVE